MATVQQNTRPLQNIKIKFNSYNSHLLDKEIAGVIYAANRNNVTIVGPICLPNKTYQFTVNRSPHVDSKAKDRMALIRHSRMIILLGADHTAIEAISSVNLASGVGIEIEVMNSNG
jgi:small subunit ribosomal protein S10